MALETLTPTTHRMLDLDKPLYTISVAAEILASHPRTLMMYESMGLGVPARTATNRRRYTQRDILTLTAIQRLTRQHGLNIAGVMSSNVCNSSTRTASRAPPSSQTSTWSTSESSPCVRGHGACPATVGLRTLDSSLGSATAAVTLQRGTDNKL
jgi:hypothetical protein